MLKRIVGIDYGQVRIGIAVSDPNRILASPLGVVQNGKTPKETAQNILAHLKDLKEIDSFVIGWPLLLSGKKSPSCELVEKLAQALEEATSLSVVFWDERLTTAQVERTLKEANLKRKQRKKHVDTMAAAVILQSYLDSPCNKSEELI